MKKKNNIWQLKAISSESSSVFIKYGY